MLVEQNEYFLSELSKLNVQQRAAVDAIEGPVLVVAGPGTGKTHILASRIGNILLRAQADPHNILCLTYTDAGVQAMRQRLLSLIGAAAHKVHIYTYHAFCSNVIRSNPDYFGLLEAEPIERMDRLNVIAALLEKLPTGHILQKAYNPSHYQSQLEWLFGVMKREEWTLESIETASKTFLESLPSRKDFIYKKKTGQFKAGDLKIGDIEELTHKMNILCAAAALFEPYQKALTESGQYDFDDMIAWVVDAFSKNENLLRRYQEQYLYFLVDEYQDTNGSQDHILRQLYAYWGESPNIFIVGDDDQAIYEFQGAKLEHLTHFYSTFQTQLELIVLKDNYRSSQPILDAAHELIQHNKERLIHNFEVKDTQIDKKLVANNPLFNKNKAKPSVAVYENPLHEISDIVAQIQDLQAQNVSLNTIAVLYAKHKEADVLTQMLEKSGIPYNTKRKLDILGEPIIEQLRTILKYVVAETNIPFSGEQHLFKLLHFPYFDIAVADIAALSFYKINYERHLNNNLETEQSDPFSISWRMAIADDTILGEAKIENIENFKKVALFLDELLRAVHTVPLQNFIEILINRSGLLAYAMQQQDKIWLLEVLQTFSAYVRNKILQQVDYKLPTLLDTLTQMQREGIGIDLQKNILVHDGVMLSTAHGVKGLEFEYVFVINAISGAWENAKKNETNKLTLPDTLTLTNANSEDNTDVEGRRRLFFVAMTRAKRFLQISYSKKNEQGKAQIPSLFLSEIEQYTTQEEKQINVTQLTVFQELILSSPHILYPNVLNNTLVQQRVQEMVLSITALSHYWDCPLSFYLQDVLKMPTGNSASALYGTAIHHSLYQYFKAMSREKNIFPNVSYLLDVFRKEMKKRKTFFETQTYEQYCTEGTAVLLKYHDTNAQHWNTAVELEVFVHDITIADVPVKGMIDKIEMIGGNKRRVIDYKTGKIDPQNVAKRSSKHNGGDYWNQLLFYKLLYVQRFPQTSVPIGVIDYVTLENVSKSSKPIEFTDDDATWMRNRIKATYQQILNLNFYKGCGKKDCQWCNFVQNSTTPTHFDNMKKENLDDGLR